MEWSTFLTWLAQGLIVGVVLFVGVAAVSALVEMWRGE